MPESAVVVVVVVVVVHGSKLGTMLIVASRYKGGVGSRNRFFGPSFSLSLPTFFSVSSASPRRIRPRLPTSGSHSPTSERGSPAYSTSEVPASPFRRQFDENLAASRLAIFDWGSEIAYPNLGFKCYQLLTMTHAHGKLNSFKSHVQRRSSWKRRYCALNQVLVFVPRSCQFQEVDKVA